MSRPEYQHTQDRSSIDGCITHRRTIRSEGSSEPSGCDIAEDCEIGRLKLVPVGYSLTDDPAAVERAADALADRWNDDFAFSSFDWIAEADRVLRTAEGDA